MCSKNDKEYYESLYTQNKWKLLTYVVVQVALCAFAVIFFASCGTKKVATPSVQLTNLEVEHNNRWDSIGQYNVINIRDSVRIKDSIVTHVDASGNVVKQEIWHSKESTHEKMDSSSYWHERFDSLLHKKDSVRTEVKVEYVEKELSKWQKSINALGYVMLGVIALGIVYVCVRLKRKFML